MNWQSSCITLVLIWNKRMIPLVFFGIQIEHDASCLLEMKQEGLIDNVIEALGLDVSTMNGIKTPAKAKPLVKDTDGEIAHGDFSYSSVVGMMLYLALCSQPDIAYAVNCDACYMFCPRHSHELVIKMIGRYLRATCSRRLIFSPSSNLISILMPILLETRDTRKHMIQLV